ncbi:MAG: hypothetical protein AAGB14_05525 [Verrucomicrobiota bacterium]
MRLPRWLWRFLKSRFLKRLLVWGPWVLLAILAAGYAWVNHSGRVALEDAKESLTDRGFATTFDEAIGIGPGGGERSPLPDLILEEVRRIETDDEQIGDVHTMNLPGLKEDVWLDDPGEKEAPEISGLFEDSVSDSEAAIKLLRLLEPYEARRRKMVEMPRSWWSFPLNSGEASQLMKFRLHGMVYLRDHALVAAAAGRKDLAAEDLETLVSWIEDCQESPKSLMQSVIGIGEIDLVLDVMKEMLISESI